MSGNKRKANGDANGADARGDVAARNALQRCLLRGLPLSPLPPPAAKSADVPHAPCRTPNLSPGAFRLAVANALRYFPREHHDVLRDEFATELATEGHIYMRRFRPTEYEMKAYPLSYYPAKCAQSASMIHMIMNNLDKRVAQYPEELITYGGNGSVFSNWAQYHLVLYYLCTMTDTQTLALYSGHPHGLFPSHKEAPRAIVTNGMVIPNHSSGGDYDRMYAMGVSQYGQMTAGSFCYIGPQGIVHGTTITILNAGRMYLNTNELAGKVYVSSGLGGMSGAQAKAAVICGAVCVIAEIDPSALNKRHEQGWVMEKSTDVKQCVARIKEARAAKQPLSIGYCGNIVTLWEALAAEPELLVELGSDQTSCHNVYGGGYMPVDFTFEEGQALMVRDHAAFKEAVHASLRRQVTAINTLTKRGMRFWDYGNSFLLSSYRAGADILKSGEMPFAPGKPAAAADIAVTEDPSFAPDFRYPTYVQEIMGNIFSLGFGPFRWVCTSADAEDLAVTDTLALEVMTELCARPGLDKRVVDQLRDNMLWIKNAKQNKLVVGSQARILYADAAGRKAIAEAMNKAVKDGRVSAGIVLSRDHHDVSGTDSPFRETSNITDGSMFCADMSVHNAIGDSFRGATWVALHNGGGCGWGEVSNGGFGLFLDGTAEASTRASGMLDWDVNNGVARRAWARNDNAVYAVKQAMAANPLLTVTLPTETDDAAIDAACKKHNK